MSSNNFRLGVFRLAHSLASAVACNKGAPDSHLDCCLPPEEGMWWWLGLHACWKDHVQASTLGLVPMTGVKNVFISLGLFYWIFLIICKFVTELSILLGLSSREHTVKSLIVSTAEQISSILEMFSCYCWFCVHLPLVYWLSGLHLPHKIF